MSRGYNATPLWGLSRKSAVAGIFWISRTGSLRFWWNSVQRKALMRTTCSREKCLDFWRKRMWEGIIFPCERRAQVWGNLRLVWIWPLPIHHLALSKSQRRKSVNIRWANILRKLWKRSLRRRWKTRDGKDVCYGLVGKTTSWVNTAVLPGWVGGRALLLILAQGLRDFMNSSCQPEFMRLMRPVL